MHDAITFVCRTPALLSLFLPQLTTALSAQYCLQQQLSAHLPRTTCNLQRPSPSSICLSDSHQTSPHSACSVHTCTCNHAHRQSSNSTPDDASTVAQLLTCLACRTIDGTSLRRVFACQTATKRHRTRHAASIRALATMRIGSRPTP